MGAIGDGEWGIGEEPVLGFGRERRLHAKAYAYWAALAGKRAMPALADLDPGDLAPFAEQSVLVEFSGTGGAPAIAFIGRALRDEAGLAPIWPDPAEVPPDSLLAIVLGCVPALRSGATALGFQSETPVGPDATTLHRGILLPFAGTNGALGAVLGVMTWRRIAALAERAGGDIAAAVESAFALQPPAAVASPWGDAAAAPFPVEIDPIIGSAPLSLEQLLSSARTWATLAQVDRTLGAAALTAALGAAYDVLCAARTERAAFAALAGQAGITALPGARAVADLVFLAADGGTRRDHAAALDFADRLGLGAGRLAATLERWEGGVPAFLAAARGAHMALPADAGAALAIAPIDADSAFLRGPRPASAFPQRRRDAA